MWVHPAAPAQSNGASTSTNSFRIIASPGVGLGQVAALAPSITAEETGWKPCLWELLSLLSHRDPGEHRRGSDLGRTLGPALRMS